MKTWIAFFFALSIGSFALADDVQSVNLVIQNGKFEPATLKVPAGKVVELVIENKGPGAEEFESKELRREKVIPMGKTVKLRVGPLKKGSYPFYGEYHEDTAQGKLVAE